MTTDTSRFDDGGTYLWQLTDAFLVRCPGCGRAARVGRTADRKARVTCTHCGLARTQAPGDTAWLGPVAARASGHCPTCGAQRPTRIRRLQRPTLKTTVAVTCGGCGSRTERQVSWWPLRAAEPRDPLLGLPLLLQTPCRGETLWAYNEAHLAFLERWVGATLRTRRPHRNGSLASRLPRWMTRAQSRGDVVECLARLRQTLAAA